MKVVKTDKRHHGGKRFSHYVQFYKGRTGDTARIEKIRELLTQHYGTDREWIPNAGWGTWKFNENWLRDAKRDRIYVKTEEILSFILLQL